MFSIPLVLLTVVACMPAFAGGPPVITPELDPGSLAALTSVGTVGYILYTVYRRKANR